MKTSEAQKPSDRIAEIMQTKRYDDPQGFISSFCESICQYLDEQHQSTSSADHKSISDASTQKHDGQEKTNQSEA